MYQTAYSTLPGKNPVFAGLENATGNTSIGQQHFAAGGGHERMTAWRSGNTILTNSTTNDPALSTWHYVVHTNPSASTSESVYQDGSTAYTQVNATNTGASVNAGIGAWTGGGNYHKGYVDEVRISNVVRSADWVTTEWNSQNAPGTFYTLGAQALPVELLSFSGRNEGEKNILKWETATETNNDYFTPERSENGTKWTGIGKINAVGSSSAVTGYEFIDESPCLLPTADCQLVYYRLKQTDYDGQYEYFGPISIQLGQFGKWQLILQNTPAMEELTATLFVLDAADLTIELFDVQGRIIQKEKIKAVEGSNFIKLASADLGPGAYFVKVYNSTNQVLGKFVKM